MAHTREPARTKDTWHTHENLHMVAQCQAVGCRIGAAHSHRANPTPVLSGTPSSLRTPRGVYGLPLRQLPLHHLLRVEVHLPRHLIPRAEVGLLRLLGIGRRVPRPPGARGRVLAATQLLGTVGDASARRLAGGGAPGGRDGLLLSSAHQASLVNLLGRRRRRCRRRLGDLRPQRPVSAGGGQPVARARSGRALGLLVGLRLLLLVAALGAHAVRGRVGRADAVGAGRVAPVQLDLLVEGDADHVGVPVPRLDRVGHRGLVGFVRRPRRLVRRLLDLLSLGDGIRIRLLGGLGHLHLLLGHPDLLRSLLLLLRLLVRRRPRLVRALLRLAARAIVPGVDAGGGRTRRGDGHLVGTRQPAVLLRLVLGHLRALLRRLVHGFLLRLLRRHPRRHRRILALLLLRLHLGLGRLGVLLLVPVGRVLRVVREGRRRSRSRSQAQGGRRGGRGGVRDRRNPAVLLGLLLCKLSALLRLLVKGVLLRLLRRRARRHGGVGGRLRGRLALLLLRLHLRLRRRRRLLFVLVVPIGRVVRASLS